MYDKTVIIAIVTSDFKHTLKEYIFQNHDAYTQFTRLSSTAGPWYMVKTETVGVESCPVHGHGHGHGHGEGESSKYRTDKKVAIKCF